MPLTAEKYWRGRIARKIDRKIEALTASDPTLLGRVAAQARQRALQSLGLAEMQAELDAVAAQRKELHGRARQAQRAMLATVRRVPLEEVPEPSGRGTPRAVAAALRKCQAGHEEALLAADELGRAILRLRREKEGLRDTVWPAAAPAPVRELWRQLCALLGEEPTPLQREALALGAAAAAGRPA